MTERKTLLETLDNGDIGSGIFTFLQNSTTGGNRPEYLDGDMTVINTAYYYYHSGDKYISPLVDKLMGAKDNLSSDDRYKLAQMMLKICRPNWDKVYKALTVDYSPIENTDAYIEHTIDTTGNTKGSSNLTDSGTDNYMHSGTDTITNTGTDNLTKTGTDKTEGKVDGKLYHHSHYTDVEDNPDGTSTVKNQTYGFNSDAASDDSTSTTTVKQKVTNTHTTISDKPEDNSDITDNTTTDTTTYNTTDGRTIDTTETTNYNSNNNETVNLSHTGSTTEDTTGKETYNEHRHGNIGVTTNQYMINEELELRKNFFLETVFTDLDKYLCLSVY